MGITNHQTGTNIHEIADGIYRINTPVHWPGGGFTFNQYLILDDQPLLFHTGPRKMFPLVSAAVATVMPLDELRYVALSHVEADECGSLNQWLAVAPQAVPVCGRIAATVSINDLADRPPQALADGELLRLGQHVVRWYATPHLPHGWDCGYLMEEHTRTLLCGDLFTQDGANHAPLTAGDILGPSEASRQSLDYYAHTAHTRPQLQRLAATRPATLACMHGSAWTGDGEQLLLQLADELER